MRFLVFAFATVFVACSATSNGGETSPADLTGKEAPPASSSAGNPTGDPNPAETQSARPRCGANDPFDKPASVGGLEIDGTARFTPDELGVVFSNRSATGVVDLFQAKRASISDAFGAPSRLTGIEADGAKLFPALANDQKTLWFASMHETDNGTPRVDIFTATRSTESSSTFNATEAAIALNVFRENTTPFATKHAAEVWYAAGPSADMYEIFKSTIATGGVAGKPIQVTELNTEFAEAAPVLSDDGLLIYWSSTRPDGGAKGEHDVWTATRDNVTARFGAPRNVKEINTAGLEYPAWLSPDLCRLYIARSGSLLVASRTAQ